jgi:hypothetical protein
MTTPRHTTLIPLDTITLEETAIAPFTHVLTIASAGYTFESRFECPGARIWLVPTVAHRGQLKIDVGGWEYAGAYENELGAFLQCLSEAIHFFAKKRVGMWLHLLRTAMECTVYFGRVYHRLRVDADKTVWPVRDH